MIYVCYRIFFECYHSDAWLAHPQCIIGLLIFLSGAYINITSDYHLLSLRIQSQAQGNKTETTTANTTTDVTKVSSTKTVSSSVSECESPKVYFIPYGGLFEYVSCANYCKS